MAKTPKAAARPVDEDTRALDGTRIQASAEFEHDGMHFTAGFHRVDDVTATAIVAAGKATYALPKADDASPKADESESGEGDTLSLEG